MLPRTNGFRTTNFNRFVYFYSLDTIGNNSIQSPISSTNHITSTNTSYTFTMFFILLWIKERTSPRSNCYFCCSLTTGIRVITTHRFILTIAPKLLFVFITFISSYHDTYLYAIRYPYSFQYVNRPYYIRFVRFNGNFIT